MELDRFGVILADPPWRYDFSKDKADRIEAHYATMRLEEIGQLPLQQLAGTDCVLFLWATSPKMLEAFTVIREWGFTYKTSMVWRKEGPIGMGYYARINHELLLIATRGKPRTPPAAARPHSVVSAPKKRHSEKPPIFHEIIERMYPQAKRLELFCRNPRPGWYAWGHQAEGAFIVKGQEVLDLGLPQGTILPLDYLAAEAA